MYSQRSRLSSEGQPGHLFLEVTVKVKSYHSILPTQIQPSEGSHTHTHTRNQVKLYCIILWGESRIKTDKQQQCPTIQASVLPTIPRLILISFSLFLHAQPQVEMHFSPKNAEVQKLQPGQLSTRKRRNKLSRLSLQAFNQLTLPNTE